jgi:predicted MFS family arabinose efflux permease
MDIFLIVSAIALLIFGALLVLMPDTVKKISDFLNRSVLPVEDKMRSSNVMSGVILIAVSVIVFYIAMKK